MSEPIYITFSKSQGAFHREANLAAMAMSNLRQLRSGGSPDWIVVGYAANDKEATEVYRSLARILLPHESAENPA